MKNRESLKLGDKPAPGDLAFVQGLINLWDVEQDRDELADGRALKKWLAQHGLILPTVRVSDKDLALMISFREALRSLLYANNGAPLDIKAVKLLNDLADGSIFTARFRDNHEAQLEPAGQGVKKAIGEFILIVIKAMADNTWWRLKACTESNCRWAFYDSSKNRSGRWCSMSVCGSRNKAREYRKRKSGSK